MPIRAAPHASSRASGSPGTISLWLVMGTIRRGGLGASAALALMLPAHAEDAVPAPAAGAPPLLAKGDPAPFKGLSLEELMNVEVTSVSRQPERLARTASAIQVVSGDDIRRFGASSLPEALRLSSNLHVAQADARSWAISARGFNNTLANKMLVMMDGRTVYTPLFAGTFWDAQDYLLADIDRIEVISGPGATLWGSNAVNGVINVVSKHTRDTQGLYAEAGGGTELRAFGGARYGGALTSDVHYRVYAKYFNRDDSITPAGHEGTDSWDMVQGGYRVDWDLSPTSLITAQGDLYESPIERPDTDDDVAMSGGNLMLRWSQALDDTSRVQLQAYYDHTKRRIPRSLTEGLDTYDIDLQYSLQFGARHKVIWGLGYRRTQDDIDNPPGAAILPPDASREWYSGFLQDEIALIHERLYLTLGTKVEHNDYTGVEYQPSARFALTPVANHTTWGAVSRAVRAPSRIEADFYAPRDPPHYLLGGPDYVSETVWAYELGHRAQIDDGVSVSLAGFYNHYDDIRSVEQVNPPVPVPIVFENRQEGQSYGCELTVDAEIQAWWHVHAGYTAMRIKIWKDPGSTDPNNGATEGSDPNHILSLRTSFDLPGGLSLGLSGRYVSRLRNIDVPGYGELDARLAWSPWPAMELSVVGQNLLHDQHAEFGAPATRSEVERSVYGKVAWTF
jgi:iron complex outermembrane receptor protein